MIKVNMLRITITENYVETIKISKWWLVSDLDLDYGGYGVMCVCVKHKIFSKILCEAIISTIFHLPQIVSFYLWNLYPYYGGKHLTFMILWY